jgi:hypothetical protein
MLGVSGAEKIDRLGGAFFHCLFYLYSTPFKLLWVLICIEKVRRSSILRIVVAEAIAHFTAVLDPPLSGSELFT